MPGALKKNQIPKQGNSGSLWNSSSFKARLDSNGVASPISASNPLKSGDIVDTTIGLGQVVAVSGSRASIVLLFGNGPSKDDPMRLDVQCSGVEAL
jgi:hypothetical protein